MRIASNYPIIITVELAAVTSACLSINNVPTRFIDLRVSTSFVPSELAALCSPIINDVIRYNAFNVDCSHSRLTLLTSVHSSLDRPPTDTSSTMVLPHVVAIVSFLTIENTLALQVTYRPVTIAINGSIMCATDTFFDSVLAADVLGVPYGVPDVVRCAYVCSERNVGNVCIGFNVWDKPPLSTQCQFFAQTPVNYSRNAGCSHYQVRRISIKYHSRTNDKLPGTLVYYSMFFHFSAWQIIVNFHHCFRHED